MAKLCLIRSAEGVSPGALTATVPTLPLGLAYLAAMARSAGHDVQVIDAVGEAVDQVFPRGPVHWVGLDFPEIVARVDADTDVIGVSNMFSHNWPMVRDLIRSLRDAFPGTPILAGGEHTSSLPGLVLDESPADACAIGEAEETLLELIEAFTAGKPLEQVRGIAYRAGDGSIQHTERRDRIREVDEIPWPAWDLFDIEAYQRARLTTGLQVENEPASIPILATRGCPYQCTFCTSPQMWTTAYIARDPVKVVDEIQHYVETYGVRNFPFQDLTAILKKDWIKAFTEALIARGLEIHWQLPSGTRSEAVDDEVAGLLMKSGMAHMAYAPEAGSLRVRKAIKKRVVADRFYDSVRAAVGAGLHVQTFFVVGFPEETAHDLRLTLRMLARLAWMGVEDAAVSHYMPYPGSEMYDRLVERGKVDTSDRWLLAPLHTHGMRIPDEFQVNEHFSARTQSVYALLGFAIFYGVSAIRKPGYFFRMIIGIFTRPDHDVSRLQRALKGMLRSRREQRSGVSRPRPRAPDSAPASR